MDFQLLSSLTDSEREAWERFVIECRYGHNFQREQWGQFQQALTGRECLYLIGSSEGRWSVAAQIFVRRWPKPFASYVNYEISCGPIFRDPSDYAETLRYLDQWAAPRAVQLVVGPRWPLSHYQHFTEMATPLGFRPLSNPSDPIYPEETVLVDLRPDDKDILMSFRYTTRYEIRKAERAGVQVRFSNAPEAMHIFYDLHLQQRSRLQIAPEEKRFFNLLQEHFLKDPANGVIVVAYHQEQPLSAAIYFRGGAICRYRHGASNEHLRSKLDTSHLLHWRAMQYFKRAGCEWYDFCGASPTLPRDYPTYGTNIFKTGFTKHFVRYTPDMTKTYRPLLSALFNLRAKLYHKAGRLVGRLRNHP